MLSVDVKVLLCDLFAHSLEHCCMFTFCICNDMQNMG